MHHCMVRGKETRDTEKEKFSHEATTHLDHLYRVALYLAKESNDAKDLVQETDARVLVASRKFNRGPTMRAWLRTIFNISFSNNANKKKKWISVENNFEE